MTGTKSVRRCPGRASRPLHAAPSLPQETSALQQEAGSQGSQNRESFSRQKDWQPIATRYDGCAHVFGSAILLAAIILFW